MSARGFNYNAAVAALYSPDPRMSPAPTEPLLNRRPSPGPPDIPLLRVRAGRDMLHHAVLQPEVAVELGRDPACALVLSDASVSRRHARIVADGDAWRVEDLGSRNGTFINGRQIESGTLRATDRLEVGSVPLRLEYVTAEELGHLRRVLERLHSADQDPLTGLLTRAFIDDRLPSLLDECDAASRPVSAVFIDIDHFKNVNDTLGHAVGDDVLRQVAHLVAYTVRERESCIRYGGEEIVVVLQDAPLPRAAIVADRLRHVVASHDWRLLSESLAVTISCGVAQWTPGEPIREWLDRADRALYRAKQDGRNRVRRADPPHPFE